jgi:hypothetical protein
VSGGHLPSSEPSQSRTGRNDDDEAMTEKLVSNNIKCCA